MPHRVFAELIIYVLTDDSKPGMILTLQTRGDFASEDIDNRTYSLGEQPPDDISPADFWAPLLGRIASFLGTDDDS